MKVGISQSRRRIQSKRKTIFEFFLLWSDSSGCPHSVEVDRFCLSAGDKVDVHFTFTFNGEDELPSVDDDLSF